jgi:DNA repair protein RadC
LAALIGGPSQIETATLLLTKFGSLSAMQAANVHDVSAVRGVGKQTAARVLAALQIGLRAATETIERKSVNSPADAYHVLRPCFEGKEQEYLFSLLLDTRNRILGEPVEIYHGSLNSTLLRVGEIFREAIKANAASLIIAHNHPSGDPSPSPDDTAVTRLIVEAGRLLDIPLHDHLVIGQNRFVSLKERGLGFS